jgi:hypothetical protein
MHNARAHTQDEPGMYLIEFLAISLQQPSRPLRDAKQKIIIQSSQ